MSRSHLAALIAILMLFSILMAAYCQEISLTVHVHDPLRKSLDGIEVRLIRGVEVRRFVTNSTGYAEFKYRAGRV
jgi:hypothetical protein